MYAQVEKSKVSRSSAVANPASQRINNAGKCGGFGEVSTRSPIQALKRDAIKYIKSKRAVITKEQLGDNADYWEIINYLRGNCDKGLKDAWNKDQPNGGRYVIRDSDLLRPTEADYESSVEFLHIYMLALGMRECDREARKTLLNTWREKAGEQMKPTEKALVDKNLCGDEMDLDPLVAVIGTDYNQEGRSLLLDAVELHYAETGKVPLHMAAYLYNQGSDWTKELNEALLKKIIGESMIVKVSHAKIGEYLKSGDVAGLLKEAAKRSKNSFGTWNEIATLICNGYVWDGKRGALTKAAYK